jgi:hypothetical protein
MLSFIEKYAPTLSRGVFVLEAVASGEKSHSKKKRRPFEAQGKPHSKRSATTNEPKRVAIPT